MSLEDLSTAKLADTVSLLLEQQRELGSVRKKFTLLFAATTNNQRSRSHEQLFAKVVMSHEVEQHQNCRL